MDSFGTSLTDLQEKGREIVKQRDKIEGETEVRRKRDKGREKRLDRPSLSLDRIDEDVEEELGVDRASHGLGVELRGGE